MVFCHDDDVSNAAALIARLAGAGFSVTDFACDVADEAAVDRLAEAALSRLGRVDVLVNCAGIGDAASFDAMSVAEWDRMIAVNLRGTFLVTRAFYAGMVARGAGRIINVSSQLAQKGASALAHYCASKAGILGFTRALAMRLRPTAFSSTRWRRGRLRRKCSWACRRTGGR